MKRALLAVGLVVVVSACSADAEPVEEAAASPSPAAAESPSESPEVVVDPESAKWICEDLRLRDAYVQAEDLAPHEVGQDYVKASDAWMAALEEDAEPELREIAEAASSPDGAVDEMTAWCKEHTEPINPTSPW